jgi:hypothetical protein
MDRGGGNEGVEGCHGMCFVVTDVGGKRTCANFEAGGNIRLRGLRLFLGLHEELDFDEVSNL